jgi:hypothetical protein
MRLRTLSSAAVLLAACGSQAASPDAPSDAGADAPSEAGAESGPDADSGASARDVVRECPAVAPDAGVACGDLAFLDCRYGELLCRCGGQEHFQWSCDEDLDGN